MDPTVNQPDKAKSDGVDPPPDHTIDIKSPKAEAPVPPPAPAPAPSDQKSTVPPGAPIALETDAMSTAQVLATARSTMETVKDALWRWGKNVKEASVVAQDLSKNTWQHCKYGIL